MKLFEYAVIYLPEDEDGNVVKADARVVVPPTTKLATSDKVVAMQAAKEIPESLDLEFVQVVVRPF